MAAADSANQARLDKEAAREAARQKRMDELKAEREKRMAEQAAARAASDPMKNPTVRPEAPPADGENVYYYSWIGGASSGNWKLYEQPLTGPADKVASAEARSEGGATQATFSSAVGAQTLKGTATTGSATAGSTTANSGSSTGNNTGSTTQNLPAGFTPGPFPSELEKYFGAPPENILGYKLTEYKNAAGQTYYKLSISQKGAYGNAISGSSEFGAPITKDASGKWTIFQGDYSGVSTGTGTGSGTGTGKGTGTGTGTGFTPTTYTAPDGRIFTDLNSYNAYIAQQTADQKRQAGQSAYNLLFEEFNRYGLGALVAPLQNFIVEGLSPAEFTLRLRDTDAYKKRFAANQARVQKGLTALSEAEYIGLEDQYQNVMRQYGLPEAYYSRGDMGRQEGFEKFIANDIAPTELEDRIITAQNRVLNAAPEVGRALREFYPDITNGDILAYALDPQQALTNIKRKVTAAEIGAGALQAGLKTGASRAEELQRFGVTGEQARQGFQTIADVLPTASKLGDIYAKQGMGAYDQATAEQEVFGITGAAQAAQKRRKLAQLETAQFSGTSGAAGGALGRERAGQF